MSKLVVTEPASGYATDSAEAAARLMRETNDLNLPVVDSEDRLVGLFTIDDAVEVIEAADTEDVPRQAGAAPWAGHCMAASVWQIARYRTLWLSLLLVAATFTGRRDPGVRGHVGAGRLPRPVPHAHRGGRQCRRPGCHRMCTRSGGRRGARLGSAEGDLARMPGGPGAGRLPHPPVDLVEPCAATIRAHDIRGDGQAGRLGQAQPARPQQFSRQAVEFRERGNARCADGRHHAQPIEVAAPALCPRQV